MISPTSQSNLLGPQGVTADRVPKQNLDQEDFLQLLSVQLAQQDPTKPVDSTDFIAQMAQFSSLEQSTKLANDMSDMRGDARFQVANSFIGREVTFEDTDGTLSTGTVTAVEPRDGDTLLDLDGTFVPISAVVRVAPPTSEPKLTTQP